MQGRLPTSHSYRALWLVAYALLAACLLEACDAGPTVQLTPAPTTAATSASTLTLPTLTAEAGWHKVFTLDNSAGAQGAQQSFTASKPYVILYSCSGSGNISISYGQKTESTACSTPPQLNGTDVQQPATAGETIIVSVTATGNADWELLVSMKD